ncbi:hypothetical protein EW146_g8294 [Bondarzewia mesenterica]|uniref:acetate--CoA ligase n=1 Tax=Bondarzewia mesenterica TaxID=1095465 RepID=A0A4S4LFK3_9AGAM|nr:hypothetical protein EW146_g8294 [Bondarzewia mesenterica]
MSAEDPLFILYVLDIRIDGLTQGHRASTGGYLLGAALTIKYVYDVHPDNKFACMADIGWIIGHIYILYGLLTKGVLTTVFKSMPVYPTPSRYWQTIKKHLFTQFYSTLTTIQLLHRLGSYHVELHDLSSLRVLSSMAEPINPEAWNWYKYHFRQEMCTIVDTFWQTDMGSTVVTPFTGAIET